jgi:hypothetical protein
MDDKTLSLEEAQDYWAEGVNGVMQGHAAYCYQMMKRTMTRRAALAEFRREFPRALWISHPEPLLREAPDVSTDGSDCWVHAEVQLANGPTYLVSGRGVYQHTYTWQ